MLITIRRIKEELNMHSDKYGYTLVEILVVVAIVLLLMAVVIPAVSTVQKKGLQAICMSNMKQIGSALDLYAMDYDYYYPKICNNTATNYRWDVFLARNGYVTGVAENVSETTGAGDLFICPLHLKMAKREGSSVIRSYGMNAHMRKIGGDGSYDDGTNDINVKKIWCEVPYSEAMLVAEASDNCNAVYNEDWGHVAWTRHGDKSNYLFADGHVESLLPSEATNYFEWQEGDWMSSP